MSDDPPRFMVRQGFKGWMVYDVVIDGASLVTTYRGSFNDQIQKGGVDGLIKSLKERNATGEPAKK